MTKTGTRFAWLAASVSALALAACGGHGGPGYSSSGGGSASSGPPPTAYAVSNLVSDLAGDAHQDPNLVNGWGIAFGPTSPVWVADNGTNKSTLYDGNGKPIALVVSIPPGASTANIPGGTANPTGVVFNGSTGFTITQGAATAASSFIFVGEEGTISGWAGGVNLGSSITMVDNSAAGAVYKGLAIYTPTGGPNLLFVTNFHSGKVEVYDSNFHATTVANGFVDPNPVPGYAPFGIQTIGTNVFVTYAEQDNSATPAAFDEVDGAGLGYVDEYDTTGKFIMRLDTPNGHLNAPWGVAMAPSNFGTASGDILVGSFGDGTIAVYDPTTGAYMGKLSNGTGNLTISGLWGIAFGNGSQNQPTNTLYFAAGPSGENHGVYGRIDLPGTYTAPAPPATPPSSGAY